MRIGVIGDIHGNYGELLNAFRQMGKVDHLIFTGDGIREIRRLKEETGIYVRGVRGNCDFVSDYPDEDYFHLNNCKILLVHGHMYGVKSDLTRIGLLGREKEVQLVIFGHTHLPLISEWNEVKLFNPGTLCKERSFRGISYGLIEVTETETSMSICRL